MACMLACGLQVSACVHACTHCSHAASAVTQMAWRMRARIRSCAAYAWIYQHMLGRILVSILASVATLLTQPQLLVCLRHVPPALEHRSHCLPPSQYLHFCSSKANELRRYRVPTAHAAQLVICLHTARRQRVASARWAQSARHLLTTHLLAYYLLLTLLVQQCFTSIKVLQSSMQQSARQSFTTHHSTR